MSERLTRLRAASVTEARADAAFPAGTIGVVSADLARYSSFAAALLGVKYPYGTTVIWRRGCDLVNHFNQLVRDFEGDWLWFLGDDHEFDTDILIRLLSRLYDDGLDLVAPLCLGRMAPFPTVVGDLDAATRRITVRRTQDCVGLMKADVVGSAGLLVRRRVFDAVGAPWFEAGSIVRTGLGEDWHFCLKAKQAGFQLAVDADIPLGHTTSMTIWPHAPGTPGAGARLDLGDGCAVALQHTSPSEAPHG